MPGFEAGPNKKDIDEGKEVIALELHTSGLHDENEAGGEIVDLATGKLYDNSTATQFDGLRVVEGGRKSEDILGTLPEENDAAAKWLREHEEKQKREGDDFKKAA